MVMTKKLNKQNFMMLSNLKEEVDKLKENQIINIQRAFVEIQRKLDSKRDALKNHYASIYDKEHIKLEEKLKPLERFEENLQKVEEIYLDIKNIMSKKN